MQRKIRWVPRWGNIEEQRGDLIFHGSYVEMPSSHGENAPPILRGPERRQEQIGIILSNQEKFDSKLSCEILFEDVGPSTGCEVILGFDHAREGFLVAGFSSFLDVMFNVREWSGSSEGDIDRASWTTHSLTGSRDNFRSGRPYELLVERRGSLVELYVDDVRTLMTSVPDNKKMHPQIGFRFQGHSKITVSGISVEGQEPTAFIVTQFGGAYDEIYTEVVTRVLRDAGCIPTRADEIQGPGLIIEDITERIRRSTLVIADISPKNPNVYFEVGYALALRKPIILLAARGTLLPFDVSGFRVLFYDDSIGGKSKLEEGLEKHLGSILS